MFNVPPSIKTYPFSVSSEFVAFNPSPEALISIVPPLIVIESFPISPSSTEVTEIFPPVIFKSSLLVIPLL